MIYGAFCWRLAVDEAERIMDEIERRFQQLHELQREASAEIANMLGLDPRDLEDNNA